MNNVLDPKVMSEFSANLGAFTKAMISSNSEIDELLKTPGIQSEEITKQLFSLKTKLAEMSGKWSELADRFNKNLNISIEEAEKLQANIHYVIGQQ